MVNKMFLVGAIVGLAGTIAIATLLSEAATAQTMQHMRPGIMISSLFIHACPVIESNKEWE